LKRYDYSSNGVYYITICTQNRKHYFGEIVEGKLHETEQSKICTLCWLDLPDYYNNCILDEFIIMPNHVHGIIIIENHDVVETVRYSLSEIVRGFKTFTAKKINIFQNTQGKPLWQSRYYDHIICDESELYSIREYIINNPINWKEDRNNI